MTSESDLEATARDIRVGYIAWCRGEVPKAQVAAEFDRFIARVKAEAWGEGATTALVHAGFVVERDNPIFAKNPYRTGDDDE